MPRLNVHLSMHLRVASKLYKLINFTMESHEKVVEF